MSNGKTASNIWEPARLKVFGMNLPIYSNKHKSKYIRINLLGYVSFIYMADYKELIRTNRMDHRIL